MRLPKARGGAAGLGKLVFVFLVERSKNAFRRHGHLSCEGFHDHRHSLYGGPLFKTAKKVPLPAGRIAVEGRLVEHQHRAGREFGPQGFKQILLGQGCWAEPQPREDLVKLILPHEIAGPLTKKIVDGLVADHDPVGFGILGQEGCLDSLLFPLRQQRQPGRIAATGCRRLGQKSVDERSQGHGSLEPPLSKLSPGPGHGHRVLRLGRTAHL